MANTTSKITVEIDLDDLTTGQMAALFCVVDDIKLKMRLMRALDKAIGHEDADALLDQVGEVVA